MAFSTKKSLLSRIREGDEISWHEFYRTYFPLIMLRGGDFYLSTPEKDELVQEVLIAIFRHGRKFQYDPAKGRFRDFIRKIIDNKARDILRRRMRDNARFADTGMDSVPAETNKSDLEQAWEDEWRAHVLKEAMDELKTRLELQGYQAFELYGLKNWPPDKVASFLDMSVNSVYVAKNRAVEKLRAIISELMEKKEAHNGTLHG